MVKYVLNFEEIYAGLQEELKEWVNEVKVSSLRIACLDFNKNTSDSQNFYISNKIQINKIFILVDDPRNISPEDKLTLTSSDGRIKFEYNIGEINNLSLNLSILSEEGSDNFHLSVSTSITGNYNLQVLFGYKEEVEIQYFLIEIRCFFKKDENLEETIKETSIIIPYFQRVLDAPIIKGFVPTQSVKNLVLDKKVIKIEFEYKRKIQFGVPTIIKKIYKNKETGMILEKRILEEQPYGFFSYIPEQEIFDGKYALHHPIEILDILDDSNSRPTYTFYYEEVVLSE